MTSDWGIGLRKKAKTSYKFSPVTW